MISNNTNGAIMEASVTLYKNCRDKAGAERTLRKCMEHIRGHAKLAEQIAALRPLYWKAEESGDAADAEAYATAKQALAAITISGTFPKRGVAGLEKYSGVICADLDHLKAKGFAIEELKQRVAADHHTLFCFASPSGDGLKIGVRVESGAEEHEEAFRGMQRYIEAAHGVRPDDKCKDVSRLCFLSHDPTLHINEHAAPLDWRAWPEPVEAESEDDEAVALPLEAFPLIMQQLAKACAETYMVDAALPAVAAHTIMAAALGGAVQCVGAVSGRSTPCNVFTVIAAPPSYGKGVVSVVAKPLLDANTEVRERFEAHERPQLMADCAIAEGKKKTLLSELKDGGLTPAGEADARKKLGALEADIQRWTFEAGHCPALLTGSFTGAALGIALKRNGEKMLSFALEAADAIRVAAGRFSADNKGDYDLLLSGYTGESFNDTRVSRASLSLSAPCLSVLWSAQPSLLAELFGTAEAQERGLLARINVVRCEHDLAPLDDGIVREVPPLLVSQWDRLVRAALDLRRTGRKVTFTAEPAAAKVFRDFHNEAVELRNGEGRESEAKLMRSRESAIRIAITIAALGWLEAGAESETPILSAEDAARGVAIAQFFNSQTLLLTNTARMEQRGQRLAKALALVTAAGGSITLRQLRNNHGFSESEVRQIAERSGDTLSIEVRKPSAKGGQPSPRLVAVQK